MLMPPHACVYQARYVFPVAHEPISDGVVAVREGLIEYVGADDGRSVDVHFSSAAIIPGLVNAHTHLELGGLHGKLPRPNSFSDWLREVVAFRRSQSDAQLQESIRRGVQESLAAGVTLLGDIASRGVSWPILAQSALAAVVFYEVIGMVPLRAEQAYALCEHWLQETPPTPRCRPGVSPHAPYTVSADLYRRLAHCALARHVPIATHWAESREELQLLAGQGGPLRDFLQHLGAWDSTWDVSQGIDLAGLGAALGNARTLLVHANYPGGSWTSPYRATFRDTALPDHDDPGLDPALRDALLRETWAVAFCPRTHAYFGHRAHRFRDMMAEGITVCLGTDSLASAPSLSILDELRFLFRTERNLEGATLLRMGTYHGARALGFASLTGTLEPGKWADFAVIALPDREEADPHRLLFDAPLPVQATLCQGKIVFQAGT